MAAPFKQVGSPFNPNANDETDIEGYEYKGVFLDQDYDEVPTYYSVRADEPQALSVNGKDLDWYFHHWETTNATVKYTDNPTTPVVFDDDGAVVNCYYRWNLAAASPSATFGNNGAKMSEYNGDDLQLVYEDQGSIWQSKQNSSGEWQKDNCIAEATVSVTHKTPATAFLRDPQSSVNYNPTAVAWFKDIAGTDEDDIGLYFSNTLNDETFSLPAGITALPLARPAVFGYYRNSAPTLVTAFKGAFPDYKDKPGAITGLLLWFSKDDHLETVSTDSSAGHPSLDCYKYPRSLYPFEPHYMLAWQADGDISYTEFQRSNDAGTVTFSNSATLSDEAGSTCYDHQLPSVYTAHDGINTGYVYVVWQAMKSQRPAPVPVLCYREKAGSSGSWSPTDIFLVNGILPLNPVVTAWDNDPAGGIDNAAIAWEEPAFLKKTDGVWETLYGTGSTGANPILTAADNTPYWGYTEADVSPYRIRVQPIISGVKGNED